MSSYNKIDMENSLALYIVGAFLLVNLLLGLWAGRGVKDFRDYAVGTGKPTSLSYWFLDSFGLSRMKYL